MNNIVGSQLMAISANIAFCECTNYQKTKENTSSPQSSHALTWITKHTIFIPTKIICSLKSLYYLIILYLLASFHARYGHGNWHPPIIDQVLTTFHILFIFRSSTMGTMVKSRTMRRTRVFGYFFDTSHFSLHFSLLSLSQIHTAFSTFQTK